MSVPVRSVPKASAAQPIPHYIGGARVPGSGAASSAVFNPATGAQTGLLPLADAAQVDAAVQAAQAAFPAWAATPPQKRARVMFKLRDILEARADELAAQITAEHGKTHSRCAGRSLSAGWKSSSSPAASRTCSRASIRTENVGGGVDATGASASRSAWWPASRRSTSRSMVPMWMAPIAIACGNTFVLKPSERDPSASLLLAEWFAEAGLPPGVFNVVHGDKRAVDALLEHPEVKAISFVGSTPIAKYIYETGARHGKRVQALGGAKNHMLVMPDADWIRSPTR
jgi:malonate-semialdehyde dehydrogenase (acetylating)/methylmalonate-semialdehyde dehydrogenase